MRRIDCLAALLAMLTYGAWAGPSTEPPPPPPLLGAVLQAQPALADMAPAPEVDPAHRYTLPELIDLAARHDPATRIAWIDARSAASAADTAKRSWEPRVSATALTGYQRQQLGSDGQALPVTTDTSGHGTIGLVSLQWLLFDFGERKALAESAEQGAVAANIGITAVHQKLIESVCLAYYAYGASRARLDVAERTLANSRDLQDAARARFAQGMGTVVDVAQANQGVAQAVLARVQAQGRERDDYHALIAAMGLPPLTQMKIADAPVPRLDAETDASVEHIVTDALARRPDVQAAYAALQASRASAKASAAARLPKVFVGGAVARGSGGGDLSMGLPTLGVQGPTLDFAGRGTTANVFIGVTIPLVDAGTREAAQVQAQERVDAAQARLDQARQHAALQVVLAHDGLQTALASAEAAQTLQDTSTVTHDAAMAAYRHGVGTISAVTMADTQLLQAGQALADARAAAQSAAVTMAFATGALGAAPP